MAEIPDKVADAVEDAANAQAAHTEAATENIKAETAKHLTEGAVAATAAATAVKALAETTAAETIKENEETQTWLKQSVEQMGSSLGQLHQSHSQLVESIPGLLEAQRQKTISEMKELLTPPRKPESETKPLPPENPDASPDTPPVKEKLTEATAKKKRFI